MDKSGELSSVNEQINKIKTANNKYTLGNIIYIQDYIIHVTGLDDAFFFERVVIGADNVGYITKIEATYAVVAIIKKNSEIAVCYVFHRTNEPFLGIYSNSAIGRVIDIFGIDRLTDKKFKDILKLNIETNNIPIVNRAKVSRPLLTGITGIDLIYPIGKGQRQLIIGDKKTGKTQICIDTIVNQKDKGVICIYNAIGKTKKEVKQIYYELLKRGAMKYTIIIAAFYEDAPTVLTLTPYFALSVAQLYMSNKYDVLVVIDDLKKHADAYREIGLMSSKTPGRDAYPADIFYFHSRLLEKGCQHKNGGSISILPIMETKSGDITDYISTNIISITDGQIVLSSKNFDKGEKPAIDYGLSVSRLGGAVQDANMKKLGAKVRSKLLTYLETRDIYELANTDEMTEDLRNRLFEGKKIVDALKQYKYSPITPNEMMEKLKFVEEENNG